MIFKIFIELLDSGNNYVTECRVIAAENGPTLERRIDNILSNLKADGYKEVRLRNCRNISEPTVIER